MSVGVVVAFAKALKVSSDEILGLKKALRFVRRPRKMGKLSIRGKEALTSMIDAVIAKVPDDPD